MPVMDSPISAFSSVTSYAKSHNSSVESPQSPRSPSDTKVPSAFNSTATHFTPIVLSNKPPSPSTAGKEKPSGEKDKKVARTLKELKRNLLKNRQQVHMVQELENDAATLSDHGSRSRTPGSRNGRSKSASSQRSMSPDMHAQQIGPTPPVMLNVVPSPHVMQGGPSPHIMNPMAAQQQAAQLQAQQQVRFCFCD